MPGGVGGTAARAASYPISTNIALIYARCSAPEYPLPGFIFWVRCTFLMAGGLIAWETPFLHTDPDGQALLRFVRMPYGQRGISFTACTFCYNTKTPKRPWV